MKITKRISLTLGVLLVFLFSCSTENNSLINRSYHSMKAKYNGYFNANELINNSLNDYRISKSEDYYSLLPIDQIPDEKEVVGLYSALDTAIVKCTKVIQNHAMPSNDNPGKKKEEFNSYIDENWITIGQALYYRRDFDGAMKNFKFIRKFFAKDASFYVGELWLAKTNIALGKYTEAGFNISTIDQAIAQQESTEKDKKDKKSKKEDKETVLVPRSIRFDLEKTKAQLALEKGEISDVIKFLEASLQFARKQEDKARVNFILGQLYEQEGKRDKASFHYSQVLKNNCPYAMSFAARMKRAALGSGEKLKKDLLKMLKDAKNAEYKDQIYYALAEIELNANNIPKAKENLHNAAFFSVSNARQKGMAYEKLGNLAYGEKNYISAQRYYDSCATVIPENYPNAEGIKNKAEKLSDLVESVEISMFEDSVQRIALLSEKDREDFIKDVIKKIKKDEEIRKKQEADRLIQLQQNANLLATTNVGGNKWYWNNDKTKSEGYNEFRKVWGADRENTDDWRRSDKVVFASFEEEKIDSIKSDSISIKDIDTLTVENLMKNIPLTPEALKLSQERMVKHIYFAAVIYKEQLFETDRAIEEFQDLLNRKIESEFNLLSLYQLYKIYNGVDDSKALYYKDEILNHYPNSDYANYLRDPDFFIKRKEMEALAEKEYVKNLDRYSRKLYYPVLNKALDVIKNEPKNPYLSKYMLLKVLCMGQLTEDKQSLVPHLEEIIQKFPGTMEAKKATEMLDILKNGYSKFNPLDFSNKSIFKYNDKDLHLIIIFLDEKTVVNTAKSKVVDFNREYFGRDNIKVNSKLFGPSLQSIILLEDFENDMKAIEYIRVFKDSKKHVTSINDAKILAISKENLKLLFETQKLEEYEEFYLEFY